MGPELRLMPVTRQIPVSLQPVVDYLDGLRDRASIETVRALLSRCPVSMADLAPWVRFKDDCYQRNLVCNGDHYEMLVICWKSGQKSPIHDHAGSTCGVRVMQGVCTETVFGFLPSGRIVAVGSHDLVESHVTASQDSDTHQISNDRGEADDLVTLHIYSPPLGAMRKYSPSGARDGSFDPELIQRD